MPLMQAAVCISAGHFQGQQQFQCVDGRLQAGQ